MGGFIFLCGFVLMILTGMLLGEMQEKEEEKETEKRRIEGIKNMVTSAFDDILEDAKRFGDIYYVSLNDFVKKMLKLTSSIVKTDLKAYDIYNVKLLYDDPRSPHLGRIVIDKDLTPRFMSSAPSLDREQADIELSAALNVVEVEEFARKCRDIKLGVDIEAYRKEKVRKLINGK